MCKKATRSTTNNSDIIFPDTVDTVSVRLEAVTRLRFVTPGASSHDGHLQEELQTWKEHHDRLSDSFYMAEHLQLSAKKNRFFT